MTPRDCAASHDCSYLVADALTFRQSVKGVTRTWSKTMIRFVLVLVGCLLLSDPVAAQDKATIEKLNSDFMAAFNKGDMAARNPKRKELQDGQRRTADQADQRQSQRRVSACSSPSDRA